MRIADIFLLLLRADIFRGAKFQILSTVYNIESILTGIYDFPLSNIGWGFFFANIFALHTTNASHSGHTSAKGKCNFCRNIHGSKIIVVTQLNKFIIQKIKYICILNTLFSKTQSISCSVKILPIECFLCGKARSTPFLQPMEVFQIPSTSSACILSNPFPVDFLGKLAEKIANGDHMIAEHLATSCICEPVAKNPKLDHVTEEGATIFDGP